MISTPEGPPRETAHGQKQPRQRARDTRGECARECEG